MENNKQVKASEEKAVKDVVTQDKTRRKILFFSAIGAVLVLLAAIIIGVNVFGGNNRKLQEQLDLGAKYLEEMDYEQALVAFNTALSIDPQNADAYLGIVEVYIRTNDFEAALKYAKEGYEVTGDERLKEKIDMIESGNIFASNGWKMKMSCYDGEGNLLFWYEYTYNLKGQEASVAKYNAQGVQDQFLELAYDEEGRSLIYYSRNDISGDLYKHVIEYYGNNCRVIEYEGIGDTIRSYTDIETDSSGRIIKESSYWEDGKVNYIDFREYDEKGRLIKVSYYGTDNELQYYHAFTYGEDGKLLCQQEYGSDNVLHSYIEYVYDDTGKYMGERWYDADGNLQKEYIGQ